jgi:hypothetical protein
MKIKVAEIMGCVVRYVHFIYFHGTDVTQKSFHIGGGPQIEFTFRPTLIPWSTVFIEAGSCPADQYFVSVLQPEISLSFI